MCLGVVAINDWRKRRLDNILVSPVLDFFDEEIVTAKGMNYREGQANMALDITEAFRDNKNIIVEASVGIGKSFAYLIPALLVNQISGRPIIIATSSIHLSEQLLSDAKQAAKLLNRSVNVVVGKGRNNYSCLNRAYNLKVGNDSNFNRLLEWVLSNKFGDRGKLDFEVTDREWSYFNVDKCTFERCHHKRDCHFYRMRINISDTGYQDLIIVNHDLLIVDLLRKIKGYSKSIITTRSPMIIIDEAHNLESKVRSALTKTWSHKLYLGFKKDFTKVVSSLPTFDDIRGKMDKFGNIISIFFHEIQKYVTRVARDKKYCESERFPVTVPKNIDFDLLLSLIDSFEVALTSVPEDRFGDKVLDDLTEQLDSLKQMLTGLYKDDQSNFLFWATKDNQLELHYCPKNINEILNKVLFKGNSRIVVTSATLCSSAQTLEGQYKYISDTIGFEGEFSEPKYSGYDFDKNTRLYIAGDLPDPQHSKYADSDKYYECISDRIQELSQITDGRTLVLFTSKEDLKQVHQLLLKKTNRWPILIQKEGSSQASVIEEFRSTQGLLLGTGVFWEGLDIRGDDLSQVIIVRLPFPVPDPIIEYKMSLSRNPNDEVLLPEMLIRLRQGAGRLIRSESDKGILSILDSRLSSRSNKKYREAVLSSLPYKQITENIDEVVKFARAKLPPSIRCKNAS